ncbi:MAG: PQQ-binding-like beta-propeller repeat protein [Bacteroidetes bacterium]|nr:PQQ-binding-like beta-propeller repeat protein [Bacteroidota bacterium]
MKKTTCILALFAVMLCKAQSDFPLLYKGELPVDARWKTINDDRSRVLTGDLTEIAMVDCKNGATLWKINFKTVFNQKKCQSWSWDEDMQVVKLTFKGEDKTEEKVVLLNDETGTVVEKGTEKKKKLLVDRKTKSLKSWAYDAGSKTLLNLRYKMPLVVSSVKARTVKITVESSGGYTWNTEIEGQIVRSICSNASFSNFGGDYLDIDIVGDKVFVMYEGISVLDLKTGKLLWTATFDNSEFDFGLMKQRQTLGRAAMPLVADNAVYVADLSKGNYKIKKYDLADGHLLWESPAFSDDAIVPELKVIGNTLLARFGGIVEQQTHIEGSSSVPERCISEPKMKGDFGVKAYDISNGKLLWETSALKDKLGDKFGSSISNFESNGTQLFVASDKNLFAFEPHTGEVIYKVAIDKLKIGRAQGLFMYNGNLVLEGDEGVAGFETAGGKLRYATNTDKFLGSQMAGDAYFVWIGKSPEERNRFIRLDLESGKILGKISDTHRPWFTPDGEEFVKFDDQKMFRYKTR